MPYTNREIKVNIGAFAAAVLLTVLLSAVINRGHTRIYDFQSVCYIVILQSWAVTVKRRILQRQLREYLNSGVLCFVILLILRMIKYTVVPDGTDLSRWLWYAYYVPLNAVPLLSFLAAGRIGQKEDDPLPERLRLLWFGWLLLSLLFLTNDLHRMVFYSGTGIPDSGEHSYGWVFLVSAFWQIVLMGAALVLMFYKCRMSSCRRRAWIPLVPVVISVILLVIYARIGGSPVLFEKKLYQIQEVYFLGWIAFWECCIRIGLVPTNTGYEEIFRLSSVQAEIADRDGRIVFRSAADTGRDSGQDSVSSNDGAKDLILRRAPVTGGEVRWREDHTAMDRMNAALEEAALRISEENELILEENRVLEEKMRYETQNRIYNEISWRTHGQLQEIGELLEEDADDASFRRNLLRCMFLGVYVKRSGNLYILGNRDGAVRSEDLVMAVRESMEILRDMGKECAVSITGKELLSPGRAGLFYDLFEAVSEAVLQEMTSMFVGFDLREEQRMTILLESGTALPEENWETRRIAEEGGALLFRRESDGLMIRLSFPPAPEAEAPVQLEKEPEAPVQPEKEPEAPVHPGKEAADDTR